MNRQPSFDGFTLIELIVVIVLMAILAAFAAPRFIDAGSFEGPAFAQELASAARYAQKLAVANGCPVQLNVTANSYSLLKAQATTPVCDGVLTMTLPVMHPATGNPFTAPAPNGVNIGGDLGTVQFSARGVPTFTPAIPADLNLTVSGRTVVINAGSGYVEVQ